MMDSYWYKNDPNKALDGQMDDYWENPPAAAEEEAEAEAEAAPEDEAAAEPAAEEEAAEA